MRAAIWILGGIAVVCSIAVIWAVAYTYVIISVFP